VSTIPILGYFGHHKCGTTWIFLIVREICAASGLVLAHHDNSAAFGDDIEAWRVENPFDFWCYTNADYILLATLNVRGFHVVRDPRDMIVSAYFSHLHSHPTDSWARLRIFRPWLQSLSKDDGLLREMEFMNPVLGEMMVWDDSHSGILQIRFEDLIRESADRFCNIFNELGLLNTRIPEAVVRDAVEHHAFERMSGGRAAGTADAGHHFRKGVPGDWRNHFTTRHVDYFKLLYNPLLLKLGYETSDDWSL
jgi:hypothetical protein